MPPTVLSTIEDMEKVLLPQSMGMAPPTVDPTNTPIHMSVFGFMAFSIQSLPVYLHLGLLFVLFILAAIAAFYLFLF